MTNDNAVIGKTKINKKKYNELQVIKRKIGINLDSLTYRVFELILQFHLDSY